MNRMEYLVQWEGVALHNSCWIPKDDFLLKATEFHEFEKKWLLLQCYQQDGIKVGDKVWVKLTGYQWWPGQVVFKTKTNLGMDYMVVFYLDCSFALVNDYEGKFKIELFCGNENKYKTDPKALQEALTMLPEPPSQLNKECN